MILNVYIYTCTVGVYGVFCVNVTWMCAMCGNLYQITCVLTIIIVIVTIKINFV